MENAQNNNISLPGHHVSFGVNKLMSDVAWRKTAFLHRCTARNPCSLCGWLGWVGPCHVMLYARMAWMGWSMSCHVVCQDCASESTDEHSILGMRLLHHNSIPPVQIQCQMSSLMTIPWSLQSWKRDSRNEGLPSLKQCKKIEQSWLEFHIVP